MTAISASAIRLVCLTPHGRGAVAVVVVAGDGAAELVDTHFVPAMGKRLVSLPINRIVFGRWGDGTDGEEIVVCRTSDTTVELNCHGGVTAAQAIVDSLVSGGAIEQAAESWAEDNTSDSIQAEALLALGEARTERAAAILLDQYRGALTEAIEKTINDLERRRVDSAKQSLATLLLRSQIGLHLTKPWRVVFAGPPNVGKSSLMNRLLGYDRSIVFDQSGTTRDLLTAPAAFDGWSVELTDTAGLRESEDVIEAAGVSRATDVLSKADLTVLVFDATNEFDATYEQLVTEHPAALLVMNKCDLCDANRSDRAFVLTSAITGQGIDELMQHIVKRLVRIELQAGNAVPFTARQVIGIEAALTRISNSHPIEAIAELQNLAVDRELQ